MSKDVNIGFIGAGLVSTETAENIVGDFLEATDADSQVRFIFGLSEPSYTDTVHDLISFAWENRDFIEVHVYKEAALRGAGLDKDLKVAQEVVNLGDPYAGVLGYLTAYADADNYLFVLFDESENIDSYIDTALRNTVRVLDLTDGGVELEGDTSDTTSPIVRVDEDGEATVVLHPDEDPSLDDWENEGGATPEEHVAHDVEYIKENYNYNYDYTDRNWLEGLSKDELKKMAQDLELEEIPRSTPALIDAIVAAAQAEDNEELGLEPVGDDLDQTTALLAAAIAAEANKAGESVPEPEAPRPPDPVLDRNNISPLPTPEELLASAAEREKRKSQPPVGRTQDIIVREIQELVSELVSLRKSEGESYINFTINNFNLS